MSRTQDSQPRERAGRDQFYSIVAGVQESYVVTRTASEWVPFFLPCLQPGMSLLDCGCGVGSITLDLAERVAPGQVIGIDLDAGQLEAARREAERRGLRNVRFEVANVLELPFPDASFDAALAHTLLMHLSDPLAALKEIRRVLKPGAVAGIADDDWSTRVSSPTDPLLERWWELVPRIVEHAGGSPFYARHLRSLLLDAGFARTEGHAVAADHYGTLAETRKAASLAVLSLSNPKWVATILSQGWADETELERIRAAVIAWGERPDAFLAVMYCAAVGWVDEEQ